MAISQAYKDTLRRRAVRKFVRENQRSPTDAELNQLVLKTEAAYPTVDLVGISGFDIKKPRYKDISSAEEENANREAYFDDAITMSKRMDQLIQMLEDSHRGFYATSRRVSKLLSQTESRLDNLLLLNGLSDAFLVGVEETFDTQEAIDQENTTATVEAGYVTLGRTGYSPVDLDRVKITASNSGDAKIVGVSASAPISSLKEDDGTLWTYTVYTQDQQGRVTLVINIEMPEPTYVGDVRLNGLPISVNKQSTVSLFYSLDGAEYTALEPLEQVVTPEMVFQVGQDGVEKLQITISKEAADSSTRNRNRYVYAFSLDSLKIYADQFEASKVSELFAQYDVVDDEGNPAYFTKATLTACTCEPEDTSVSFYLSQDNESWVSVSHDDNAGSYVSFADGSALQASAFLDEALNPGNLVESVAGLEDLDFQTEAIINTYVDSEYVPMVPLRSMAVKRNVVISSGVEEVLEAPPGWIFDEDTQQYSTTIYIESPEGRYIELGDTSAYINGSEQSGQVFVPQGYSTFATSDANWIDVETGILSAEALEKADPLYPFNHKYIVEGYRYSSAFEGERVYQGADDYFGSAMVYRSPEEFAYAEPGDANYYKMFTVEDVDGNWYIKVKVNKSDSTWKDEVFAVDWAVQSSSTNKLYVRALLGTSDAGQTPRIDSYKVRLI